MLTIFLDRFIGPTFDQLPEQTSASQDDLGASIVGP